MRVLYITTELPYPLTSGFLRHYHFLRVLGAQGARHNITYLSLTRRPEVSPETRAALEPLVERMMVFGASSASEPKLVKQARRLPGVGRKYQRALRLRLAAQAMKRTVQELVQREKYDLVFFSGKDTFPAIEHLEGLPLVVDCCDTTSLRVTGEMRYANPARWLWLAMRYLEVRRIEKKLLQKTPYLAFASGRDQRAMIGTAQMGDVIPQAVDLDYWTRRSHNPGPNRIIFTGVMNYPPNHDAALFLIDKVLPIVRQAVPGVQVFIVGRDPLPALRKAAQRHPEVTLTGQPNDMRDYFEQATVACAPIRFASGMQFKVLEALAMQVPMVTTPVAADGLYIAGEAPPLVEATHEHDMAAGVIKLLQSGDERARLRAAGRRFVEKHFVWESSIAKLEKMWLEAAQSGAASQTESQKRASAPDLDSRIGTPGD
ncbi:MAG: glycosyltransferase [Anaerolineales bacterium]